MRIMSDVTSPIVEEIEYSSLGLKTLSDSVKQTRAGELLFDYPTVYIVYKQNQKKQYDVYVGETNNIKQRTAQHLFEDPKTRDDWKDFLKSPDVKMIVIGHDRFNKSLTLDIENKMMLYMTGIEKVGNLNNRRENEQNRYYTEKDRDAIFSKIWKKLRGINSNLFPIERIIKDSALFKASPFHKLTADQAKAKDLIIERITKVLVAELDDQLILVEGEAGSGKTVLLSSIFYILYQYRFNEDHPKFKNLDSYILVNHDEQLKVYQDIIAKLGIDKDKEETVMKPTRFINGHDVNHKADVVFVDESHLLWTQGKQAYRGQNQLKDIMARAKVVVAIFDPRQVLKTEEYLEAQDIERLEFTAREQGNLIVLKNQLRISADKQTVDWIQAITDSRKQILPFHRDKNNYDLRIFDNPTEMYQQIKKKDADQEKYGISRMVATFDWEYTQKKRQDNQYWMVDIDGLSLPWNLQLPINPEQKHLKKHLSWAEQKQTIDEVGSTYTIQGFDLNYCGVIIGPSVQYRDGHIVFDPTKSQNKNAIHRRMLTDGTKEFVSDELLANELNVLLTRGVNGLYIYAADKQLREKLFEVMNEK